MYHTTHAHKNTYLIHTLYTRIPCHTCIQAYHAHTHISHPAPTHTSPFLLPSTQSCSPAQRQGLWLILCEGGQGASYHPASSPGTGLTTASSSPLGFKLCPRLCPQVITLPYPTCSSLPPKKWVLITNSFLQLREVQLQEVRSLPGSQSWRAEASLCPLEHKHFPSCRPLPGSLSRDHGDPEERAELRVSRSSSRPP